MDVSIILMVALVKLLVQETDAFGYTTYVFECLEDYMIRQTKYIMCIRYPNWEHRQLQIGEEGYLDFVEVRAGIDSWFDGTAMVPYKYDAIQFIKFIVKPKTEDHEYIM